MRKLLSLAPVVILLCACDTQAPTDATLPLSGTSSNQSAAPPSGFQIVDVRAGHRSHGGGATVATLAEALTLVSTNGTIRIHPGTYSPRDLTVDRPVTITAAGTERPVFDGGGSEVALWLMADGMSRVSGIRFTGYDSPIIVRESPSANPYDQVIVEDVVVDLPSGRTSGVSAYPPHHAPDGRWIEVRHSTITGGWRGLHVMQNVPDFRAVGNVLRDQSEPALYNGTELHHAIAIGYSRGASGRVEGNEISGCPTDCIGVGGGDASAGSIDIIGNRITATIGQQADNLIHASGERVRVLGNMIEGLGGEMTPGDPGSWPIRSNAIFVQSVAQAEVSGNTVRNAFIGMTFGPGVGQVYGSDNIVAHTVEPVQVWSAQRLVLLSNDFTDYVRVNIGDPTRITLQCNWWGSVAEPNVFTSDASVYTPWASQPVAGTSTKECAPQPGDDPPTPDAGGASPNRFVEICRRPGPHPYSQTHYWVRSKWTRECAPDPYAAPGLVNTLVLEYHVDKPVGTVMMVCYNTQNVAPGWVYDQPPESYRPKRGWEPPCGDEDRGAIGGGWVLSWKVPLRRVF